MAHNWEYGTRGFKSITNEDLFLLFQMFVKYDWQILPVKDWTVRASWGKNGHGLHRNTLSNYKKRLKPRWEKANQDLDKTADWSNFAKLTENGVPAERRRELHRMWVEIEHTVRQQGLTAIKPTYRSLHWWAYVVEYYGDAIKDTGDRQYVATCYATRQMAKDLLDIPVYTEDLDQWLKHRPWEGRRKRDVYYSAINKGLIPYVSPNYNLPFAASPDLMLEFIKGDMNTFRWHQTKLLGIRSLILASDEPYLLPSMIDLETVIKE